MKHIIIVMFLLAGVGCQSQAEKDRSAMQKLISTKDSIESILSEIEKEEKYKIAILWSNFPGSAYGNQDSILKYGSEENDIKNKHFIKKTYLKDSLNMTTKAIDDLKLLMGK